jgi:DNA ligase-1
MARQVKRHFLQQAHKHADKHDIIGQAMSEKLDGFRVFWDGGITNGMVATEVPWANTEKDTKVKLATGLWTRYGNIVHAPQRFLRNFPTWPVDGEMYAGRGNFQMVRSICSKHVPIEEEWQKVRFKIFDSPNLESIFYDSEVDIPGYYKEFDGILQWFQKQGVSICHLPDANFQQVYNFLTDKLPMSSTLQLLQQVKVRDMEGYMAFHKEIIDNQGEGTVLRKLDGIYVPERSHQITKNKPYIDDEGEVVGFMSGREGSEGKLLGKMGAVLVRWQGKTFKLSGFTHAEREFDTIAGEAWAINHPETLVPMEFSCHHFKRGDTITFKYRELTKDGIPKEASYLRHHEGV